MSIARRFGPPFAGRRTSTYAHFRMTHLRRGGAVFLVVLASLTFEASVARADHCPPIDNPPPLTGQNTTYCHTPKPTTAPETPAPTPAPTTAPTSRPAPAATRRPVVRQPASTASVEVPAAETTGLSSPEIVVEQLEQAQNDEIENAASASSWIFGFIVGLVIGGIIGRASWGIRRRRRQQIFG